MRIFLAIWIFAIGSSVFASEQAWKQFPYQDPASDIVFPRDEGSHGSFLEWWYAVLHLKGKTSGDQYSVLVSHFNNQIRFFTVTNLTKQKHTSGATLGILNSPKGFLDLTQKTKYGTDRFKSVGPFDYEIETHYQGMNLNVTLNAKTTLP